MKIAFFGLEEWERDYLKQKNDLPEAEVMYIDGIVNDEHLPSTEVREVEIISIFVDSHITAVVLETLPNLKFITTRSTGFDHIDLAACAAKGIKVSAVPGYGEIPVAEQTFALILTLSRHIYEGFDRIREEGVYSPEGLKGFDLAGKTLGIVGTGKIGKHVAKIANGFGLKLLAYDLYPDEAFAAENQLQYVPLENLLKQSDIVSLHVPYTKENHHLLNTERLSLMKPTALLINTARGSLIDTPALVEALKNKVIAGAGLDVLEEEAVLKDRHAYLSNNNEGVDVKAVVADQVLFDLPNVVITPHNAFNTQEALEKILNVTAENIKAYLAGTPINVSK